MCLPPILPALFINRTVLNSMLGFFSTNIALAPPTDWRSILIKVLTSSSISTPSTSIEPPSPLGIVVQLVSRAHVISTWDRLWWPILLQLPSACGNILKRLLHGFHFIGCFTACLFQVSQIFVSTKQTGSPFSLSFSISFRLNLFG